MGVDDEFTAVQQSCHVPGASRNSFAQKLRQEVPVHLAFGEIEHRLQQHCLIEIMIDPVDLQKDERRH